MKILSTKNWVERIANSRHTLWLLFILSFLETIIIPIPIEVVLIPLMASNRSRIRLFASVTLAGCLVASLVGYGVGIALYESAGTWFIAAMGYEQAYETYKNFFNSHGFWAILVVGVVPIPFQIAMITAGLAHYPLYLFVTSAVISRGLRYYGLAWLVLKFGKEALELWKKHSLATSVAAGAVLLVMYLSINYLGDALLNSGQ